MPAGCSLLCAHARELILGNRRQIQITSSIVHTTRGSIIDYRDFSGAKLESRHDFPPLAFHFRSASCGCSTFLLSRTAARPRPSSPSASQTASSLAPRCLRPPRCAHEKPVPPRDIITTCGGGGGIVLSLMRDGEGGGRKGPILLSPMDDRDRHHYSAKKA